MKKNFKVILFSMMFFAMVNISMTKNANAVVGLLIRKNVAQAVITGLGATTFYTAGAACLTIGLGTAAFPNLLPLTTPFLIGFGVTAGVGLIILEDKDNIEVNFKKLPVKNGPYKNLSARQIEIYNDELSELNAVKEEIAIELSKLKNPSNKIMLKKSMKLWKDYKEYLSPETYTVAQEISKSLQKAK